MINPAKSLLERSINNSADRIPMGSWLFEYPGSGLIYETYKTDESVQLESKIPNSLGVERKMIILAGDFAGKAATTSVYWDRSGAVAPVNFATDPFAIAASNIAVQQIPLENAFFTELIGDMTVHQLGLTASALFSGSRLIRTGAVKVNSSCREAS